MIADPEPIAEPRPAALGVAFDDRPACIAGPNCPIPFATLAGDSDADAR